MHQELAGHLIENDDGSYDFSYTDSYAGKGISLTMPARQRHYHYPGFPSFFDGLLPEGYLLEALLKQKKLDANDYFSQLLCVGQDLVGAVTVRKAR
jgi:serine/threonine-protein kinase HipA